MPNLSANALFHFTKRKYILDKLEFGFKPRYSVEFSPETDGDFFNGILKIHALRSTGIDKDGVLITEPMDDPPTLDPITRYIPMVCFCDIPLTMLERHMAIYNKYGIGLTKTWGIQNGINPILYVNEESTYFKSVAGRLGTLSFLYKVLEHPFTNIKEIPEIHNQDDFQKIVYTVGGQRALFRELQVFLKTYLKPYQSKGEYRGHPAPYRYYDEKEWRFVPFLQAADGLQPLYEGNITDAELEKLNDKLEEYPLKFNAADVKYILVEEESDRAFIVDGLNDIKDRTGKYSAGDIIELKAKIITPDQIPEQLEEDL